MSGMGFLSLYRSRMIEDELEIDAKQMNKGLRGKSRIR